MMSSTALTIERLLDIADQIIDVFDTDRQTDEAVTDAKRCANFGRQRRMRHDCRMFGETFHAAQAFGACKYAQAFKKSTRIVEIALQHERQHAAEPVRLSPGERVLRMTR